MASQSVEPASHRNSTDSLSPAKVRLSTRTRSPPQNTEGQIYCDHEDCSGNGVTFSRKSEWNKHMDKHERPYRCREPGCKSLLGFTYPGGLSRHQREVHKKGVSTKALYCPFAHCNRSESSGRGFTRLENLNEHKRRRHTSEALLSSSSITPINVRPATAATGPSIGRAQTLTTSTSPGSVADTDHFSPRRHHSREEELREIIKQLRLENRDQGAEIQRLKWELQNLPGRPPSITDTPT